MSDFSYKGSFSPLFFVKSEINLPSFIEKSCVQLFSMSSELGMSSITYDEKVVTEVLKTNGDMSVISVLFNFYDLFFENLEERNMIYVCRKLFAIGFFMDSNFIDVSWMKNKIYPIFESIFEQLNKYEQVSNLVLASIGYFLINFHIKAQDLIHGILINNSETLSLITKAFHYSLTLADPTIPLFVVFFIRLLSSMVSKCDGQIIEKSVFLSIIDGLALSVSIPTNDTDLYEELIDDLLVTITFSKIELDIRIKVFSLMAKTISLYPNCGSKVFDKQNLDRIISFLEEAIQDVSFEYTVFNPLLNEMDISNYCYQPLPLNAITYETIPYDYWNEEVLTIQKGKHPSPIKPFETHKFMPILLQATISVCHAKNDLPLAVTHSGLLQIVMMRFSKKITIPFLSFCAMWLRQFVGRNYEIAFNELQKSEVLSNLLRLVFLFSDSRDLRQFFSDLIPFLIEKTKSYLLIITPLVELFQQFCLEMLFDDIFFKMFFSCLLLFPDRVSEPLRQCQFVEKISMIIKCHQLCQIDLINEPKEDAFNRLKEMRMLIFQAIEKMLVYEELRKLFFSSDSFINSMFSLFYENSLFGFVLKVFSLSMKNAKLNDNSLIKILSFLSEYVSDVNINSNMNFPTKILQEIPNWIESNPIEISMGLISTTFFNSVTDYIVKFHDDLALINYLMIIEQCSSSKGALRDHFKEINLFTRLLPAIDLIRNQSEMIIKRLWTTVFEESYDTNECHLLKNASPLPLIYYLLSNDEYSLHQFITYILKCCEVSIESTLVIIASDFPTHIIRSICEFRTNNVNNNVLLSIIQLFSFLASYSLKTRDLISLFQVMTCIDGQYRHSFVDELLKGLLLVFQTPYDAPSSYFHMKGIDSNMKLPDLIIKDSFSDFSIYFDIELLKSQTKNSKLISLCLSSGNRFELGFVDNSLMFYFIFENQTYSGTFEYLFSFCQWMFVCITMSQKCISLFVHGKLQSKIKVPQFVIKEGLKNSYVAHQMDCNIGRFGLVKKELSLDEIRLLSKFPRTQISSFSKSEIISFNSEFIQLYDGSIYENTLYLFYAAFAKKGFPINMSPYQSEKQIITLSGSIFGYSPPVISFLKSIGGPQALIPLFTLVDLPIKGNVGVENDSTLLPLVLQILIAYLRGSVSNQQEFCETKCVSMVSFLLSRTNYCNITNQVVELIKRLLFEISYIPLVYQIINDLILDFRIWVYHPVPLQIQVMNIIIEYFYKSDDLRKQWIVMSFPVYKLLYIMRIFLWSEKYDNSVCLLEKSTCSENRIVLNRPSDIHKVRQAIWKIIDCFLSLGLSPQNAQMICFVTADISDPGIEIESFGYFLRLLKAKNPTLVETVKKFYCFESFFPLLISENEIIRAQCIHLYQYFVSLEKKEKEILLNPYTNDEWFSGIMMTINTFGTSTLFSDVVFGYLYGLYTSETLFSMPNIRVSQLSSISAFQLSLPSILPLCLLSISDFPDVQCSVYMSSIEETVTKNYSQILRIPEWDLPFVFFLIHRIPSSVSLSKIDVSSSICLRLLSRLYGLSSFDDMFLSMIERLPNLSNLCMSRSHSDFTHILRMIFISFLDQNIMIESERSKFSNRFLYDVFRLIFEYLFYIPSSSEYFDPFHLHTEFKKVTFQDVYRARLDGSFPQLSFTFGIRISDSYIWEDSELADRLLTSIGSVTELFTSKSKFSMPSTLPNTFLIFAYVLSIGLSIPSHFYTFVKHIRTLTDQISVDIKLNTIQNQALCMYLAGLIKIYMNTDRSHPSHIYLQEDSNAFTNSIEKNFKENTKWGSSIDSFDSGFKSVPYHFAHKILENFTKIETDINNNVKSYEKSVMRLLNSELDGLELYARHFRELNIVSSSSSLALKAKQNRAQILNFSISIRSKFIEGRKLFRKTYQVLSSERGPWCPPESIILQKWRLDQSYISNGKRYRLLVNHKYKDHKDASLKRELNPKEADEAIRDHIRKTRVASFMGDHSILMIERDEEKSTKLKENIDNLLMKLDAKMVTIKKVHSGDMIFTSTSMIFQSSNTNKIVVVPISSITHIYHRLYLLVDSAIEIFTSNNRTYLFDFVEGQRSTIIDFICRYSEGNLQFVQRTKDDLVYLIQQTLNKWLSGEMSNFDYLMQLNIFAGRSFNDLSQYPVFPWVLSNYTSDVLDLKDPSNYRDLSCPIGALSKKRFKVLEERFHLSDPNEPGYFYGSLYSSAAVVIGYLLRVEPFTTLHIELQSGRFDVSNRLFHSIPKAWKSIKSTPMDYRELIPEFFYFSEFLKNSNGFDLGNSANENGIVELPPWASSPENFVSINRAALESPIATVMLPNWIDLIFGTKSRGIPAIRAKNLYNPAFFDESLSNDIKTDPIKLTFAQEYVACFGSAARQIFNSSHPPCKFSILPLIPQTHEYSLLFETDSPILSLDSSSNNNIVACAFSLEIIRYNLETFVKSEVKLPSQYPLDSDDLILLKNSICTHDDNAILAYPWDCSFTIYRFENEPECIRTIRSHTKRISSIATSHRFLATGSIDCTAIIWRNNYQNEHCMISKHRSPINCIALNDIADLAVSCSQDGSIVSTALESGVSIKTVVDEDGEPKSVSITSSGTVCISLEATTTSIIKVFDGNLNLISSREFPGQIEVCRIFEYDNGEEYVVVALKSRQLVILQARDMVEIWREEYMDISISTIALQKTTLILGTNDGKVLSLRIQK